jgi:hypothetical protein
MFRFAASLLILCAVSCAPSPKDVRCTNQADCKKVDSQYGYCAMNRCVQCLDDPGCGEGNVCTSGQCVHKCIDGRDCTSGQMCTDGLCADQG